MEDALIYAIQRYIEDTPYAEIDKDNLYEFIRNNVSMSDDTFESLKPIIKYKANQFIKLKKSGLPIVVESTATDKEYEVIKERLKDILSVKPTKQRKTASTKKKIITESVDEEEKPKKKTKAKEKDRVITGIAQLDTMLKKNERKHEQEELKVEEEHINREVNRERAKERALVSELARTAQKDIVKQVIRAKVTEFSNDIIPEEPTYHPAFLNTLESLGIPNTATIARLLECKALYGAEYDTATEALLKQSTTM